MLQRALVTFSRSSPNIFFPKQRIIIVSFSPTEVVEKVCCNVQCIYDRYPEDYHQYMCTAFEDPNTRVRLYSLPEVDKQSLMGR